MSWKQLYQEWVGKLTKKIDGLTHLLRTQKSVCHFMILQLPTILNFLSYLSTVKVNVMILYHIPEYCTFSVPVLTCMHRPNLQKLFWTALEILGCNVHLEFVKPAICISKRDRITLHCDWLYGFSLLHRLLVMSPRGRKIVVTISRWSQLSCRGWLYLLTASLATQVVKPLSNSWQLCR